MNLNVFVFDLGGFIFLLVVVRLVMIVGLKIEQALRRRRVSPAARMNVPDPGVPPMQAQYLRARAHLGNLLSIANLFAAGMVFLDSAWGLSLRKIPWIGVWIIAIGIWPWCAARYGFPARDAKRVGAFSWGRPGLLIDLGCTTMVLAAILLNFEAARVPFLFASYGTAAAFSAWSLGPWRTT